MNTHFYTLVTDLPLGFVQAGELVLPAHCIDLACQLSLLSYGFLHLGRGIWDLLTLENWFCLHRVLILLAKGWQFSLVVWLIIY